MESADTRPNQTLGGGGWGGIRSNLFPVLNNLWVNEDSKRDTFLVTHTYKHTYIHASIHTHKIHLEALDLSFYKCQNPGHSKGEPNTYTHPHIHTHLDTHIHRHTCSHANEHTHAYPIRQTNTHGTTHTYT